MTSLRPSDADEAFGEAVFRVPGGNSPAGLVIVRGAQFACLGERSLLPLVGEAAVAYVPAQGSVVGLSKLARLVMALSRRAQSLEGLAAAIRDAVVRRLAPLGAAAVVVAHDASRPQAAPRTAAAASGCLAGARLVEVLAALRLAAARSGAPRPAPLGELIPRGSPGCVLSSRDDDGEVDQGAEAADRARPAPPPALIASIRTLIECCGEDPSREGLSGSADRFAAWLLEATSGGPGEERGGWAPEALETRAGWGDASDPHASMEALAAAVRPGAPQVHVSAYESASDASGRSLSVPPSPPAVAGSAASTSAPLPPRSPSPCGRGRAAVASSASPSSRPSSPEVGAPSSEPSAAAAATAPSPARPATPLPEFEAQAAAAVSAEPSAAKAAAAAHSGVVLAVEPSVASSSRSTSASRVPSASSFSDSFSDEAAPAVVYRSEFCPPSRLRRKPANETAKAFAAPPPAGLAAIDAVETEWSVSTPFSSLCEHHLLPFYGTMRVLVSAPLASADAEAPSLAKLREAALCAVSKASRRMQLQERICAAVADELEALVAERATGPAAWRQTAAAAAAETKGSALRTDVEGSSGSPTSSQASCALPCSPRVLVVAEAAHMCMVARGAAQHASSTVTVAARGAWEHDDAARAAALCRLMDAEPVA